MRRKYRRVYHFLPAEFARDDLAKHRMKLSEFGKVNDEKELQAYRLDIPDDIHDKLLAEFAESLCFSCFAPNQVDLQMWEVYGDQGRGICLGFDFKTSNIRKVEYVSKTKVASLPERLFQQWQHERELRNARKKSTRLDKCMMDLLNPYVFTKTEGWKHEQELRAFCQKDEEENGLYFANFSKNGMFLREVILGPACSVTEIQIEELVQAYTRSSIFIRRIVAIEGDPTRDVIAN